MVVNAGSNPVGSAIMPDHEEIELSITHEANGTWIAEYHNRTTDERGLAYGKDILTRAAALECLFNQLTGKEPPGLQKGKF